MQITPDMITLLGYNASHGSVVGDLLPYSYVLSLLSETPAFDYGHDAQCLSL